MTTERIDIVIREDGSRVVKRNLEQMGQAASGADSALQFMKRTLGSIAFGLAGRELLLMIDKYTHLENRLRGVGLEGQMLSSVYKELLASANATRSTLEGTIEIYARLALNSRELGVSQQDLIGFTTSLNQAIILSGASLQESQGALIQFAQGMASGTLRGDELRSVLEQLPAVADVIAKQMGVTRGELRKMGEQGKITSRVILDAFQKAAPELAKSFGKTIPTMSQSFQVLKNSVVDFVGRIGVSSGFVDAVSKSLLYLAENLDMLSGKFVQLTIVITTATAAWATFALSLRVSALAAAATQVGLVTQVFLALQTALIAAWGYFSRFFLLLNANPFTALAVAVIATIGLLAGFGGEINAGIDSITTLQNVATAFGEAVIPIFSSLATSLGEGFDVVVSDIGAGLTAVTGVTAEAAREWLAVYFAFYADVGTGFAGVIRGIAKTIDAIAGLITGMIIGVVRALTGLPSFFVQVFNKVYNSVGGIFEDLINTILVKVNELRASVGNAPIELVAFDRRAVDEAAYRSYGEGIASSIADGFEAQGGFLQSKVNDIFDRAGEIAKSNLRDKLREMEASVLPDMTARGKPSPIKPSDDGVKQAENALRSLLNTILPTEGAALELAKAQRTLNDAVAKLNLPQAKANEYLNIAREYYADIIDPMRKVNREIDDETRLLGMSARAREVENIVLNQQRIMKQQGIPLDEAASKALRDKLAAQQQFAEQVRVQDDLLGRSVEVRREFVTQLQAIQNLLSDPTKGFTKGDAAIATMDAAPELFAGTQIALDAQEAAFERMYARLDAFRQIDVQNEAAAKQAKSMLDIQYTEFKLKSTQDMFAMMATLSSSGNKKLQAIGRAAAVAGATIDGILAVQKALAAPPGWPYNAPMVVATGVAAAANVAKLAGFEQGGYTGNGGTGTVAGVVHGQEFVANARATALNRPTLEAMNRGEKVGGNITIQNSPTINIDARADRSEIMKDVQSAIASGNVQLVDRLQRARLLPT